MAEPFRVQQALFGYREGHNLVASSVTLQPSVRHFLATITDASGSETAPGFDTVYTGLPVPQTDYYALFCTWPAPEMPRPGCVWSHVLLIDLADLARIPDLSVLPKLCHRPQAPSSSSDYEQPINLPSLDAASGHPRAQEQHSASSLLTAIYGQPDSGIVVLAEDSALWEATVFALWSQQWPRLRRNFAFSTGSLGDRRLAGVTFDLQIAPPGSQRLWRRAAPPTLVLEATSDALPAPEPSWIRTVRDDLVADTTSSLRQFLFTYGSDIEKPRHAFARLATAYERLFLTSSHDLTYRLCSIGEIFPSQLDALRLKEWLVKPPKNPNQKQNLDHAWATASFLLNAPEASAYASVSIDYSDWALVLWHNKRDEVLSLFARLVRQREKPVTTAFAAALANILQPEDLRSISGRHPELIPIFMSHRPALAFDVGTWHLPGQTQSQIYETLSRLPLGQEDWAKILGAMFIAATYIAVPEVVEKAGQHAMRGAFRWLEERIDSKCLPSQAWREALAKSATNLLVGQEQLPPAPLALCAWCVPPDTARRTLSAARQDIQRLAEKPLEILPLPLRVPAAFLLLTLGLRANSPAGVKLVVRSFYPVHDALASDAYPPESWSLLSPELPYLGWWRDWDRCEKVRRAVHDWLSHHVRTGNPLLMAADTEEHRELSRRVAAGDTSSDYYLD